MPGFIGENRLSELLTLIKNKFVQNDQIATSSTAGLVKPDGTTTTVDSNGVISATAPVISSIDDINDVSITSPTDGQILTYNRTDSEWINADAPSSIPDGGTTGQVLAKKSNTDGDVEWKTSESRHTIKDNSTAVADESSLNFTDFDISDDSTNSETDIKAHRLTALEMADICSPLPGAPYRQIEYSTTEQVIGKWIDGKPLYMKTVEFTSLTAGQNGYAHGIENVDYIGCIWNASHLALSNGDFWTIFGWNGSGSNYLSNILSIGRTNIDVYIGSSVVSLTSKLVVTFQYTKTTD